MLKFTQVYALRMGTMLFLREVYEWLEMQKKSQMMQIVWGALQHQPVMRNWEGQSHGSEVYKSYSNTNSTKIKIKV
jgi:hypothetical protein